MYYENKNMNKCVLFYKVLKCMDKIIVKLKIIKYKRIFFAIYLGKYHINILY